MKKDEGCSGGHQVLFVFLVEDLPTWGILMTSKLALWLRATGSLQCLFVQEKTDSDSDHLALFRVDSITMHFLLCCVFSLELLLCLLLYSPAIFWFQLMILKEQNNQKKVLTDGVLDVNHEQESTPSANGKASPPSRTLPGSRLTVQSVRGFWEPLTNTPCRLERL